MSDKEIVNKIVKNQAERKLRDSLKANEDFNPNTIAEQEALDNYNQMNESQKTQFINKEWMND